MSSGKRTPKSPETEAGSDPRPSRGPAGAITGWVQPQLDYPTFRLSLVAKVMDRQTLRQLAEKGDCTYPEWRVMVRLGATVGGATVRQIADAAWVDRAEVSRAVASLESRGLAARRDNPQDRRAPILFLTKAGMQRYRKLLVERSAFHANLIADFTADEVETLDRLLAKVIRRLEPGV